VGRRDDRGQMSYGVTAVRYATREASRSEIFYRYHAYGEPDAPMRMDYYFWLLEGPDEMIVVDTGYDPEVGARLGRECLCEPAEAFERLGVDTASVRTLILTHLHYDHTGNLHLFPNAQLVVPTRELEFWTDPIATRAQLAHLIVAEEIAQVLSAQAEGRVTLVSGEQEVAPGVTAIDVGGHSPGQLVLRVETADGGAVLASDAIHYYEELERDWPFDVLVDLAESYRALDTLRRLTAGGETLVAGHDPLVMERFPAIDGAGAELAVRIS
jgi:glyoxylase-like metal-dependent hydrolase (beta-lactamase superfamily II)